MFWKNEATKTEWGMFNILVVIATIFVMYLFRDFFFHSIFLSQDKRLFDAISFAGTIVSIILGVLAIIYTLFQGFSQQSSSEKLATQISTLRKIISRNQSQQESFEKEMEKFEGISNSLLQISNSVENLRSEHKSNIDDVKKSTLAAIEGIQLKREISATESHHQDDAQGILPSSFFWSPEEAISMTGFLLGLGRPDKENRFFWTKLIKEYNPELHGSCFDISGVFFSIGLKFKWFSQQENGVYKIHDDVLRIIRSPDFVESSFSSSMSHAKREEWLKLHNAIVSAK